MDESTHRPSALPTPSLLCPAQRLAVTTRAPQHSSPFLTEARSLTVRCLRATLPSLPSLPPSFLTYWRNQPKFRGNVCPQRPLLSRPRTASPCQHPCLPPPIAASPQPGSAQVRETSRFLPAKQSRWWCRGGTKMEWELGCWERWEEGRSGALAGCSWWWWGIQGQQDKWAWPSLEALSGEG